MKRLLGNLRRIPVAVGMLALTAPALTVAAPAEAASYSPANTTFVAINDGSSGSSGTDPYPLPLTAYGMGGDILDIDVELPDLYHARPWDFSLLLVAPSGTAVLLKAATWCEHDLDYDRPHVSWMLSDQAAMWMDGGQCGSGWWRPSAGNGAEDHSLPAPAPPAPYATRLSAFNGENPNGTWRLYANDSVTGAQGELGQGYRLHITTAQVAAVIGGPTGGGPASPYPLTQTVSNYTGRVAEVTVQLIGLSHTYPDDLEILLVGPTGRSVLLMSDACGGTDLKNVSLTFTSSVTGRGMPDEGACGSGDYNPTDWQAGDSLPAPAPGAPYGSSLSTFVGVPANGAWKLYVSDDSSVDSGYLNGLYVSLRSQVDTTITAGPRRPSTRARSATFSFTSNRTGAGFECRLDDERWHVCTSPRAYTRLTVGQHTFRARAVAVGYTDPTPATWTWKILP